MIDLVKGQSINLSKSVDSNGLKNLRASIGWDANKFTTSGKFDLDISIFALEDTVDAVEKQEHQYTLVDVSDFCFYNTKKYTGSNTCCNGALTYSGDNRSGEGDGDDEFIDIDLSKLRPGVTNLSVVVSVSDPEGLGHNFGMIPNSFVTLTNKLTNETVCTYNLSEEFSVETAVQVASIYLYNGEWKLKAFGLGYVAGLDAFIAEYNYKG